MNKSKHMAIYIANSIIQAVQSVEFNRANWRAQRGDIIMEISDGNSELVVYLFPRGINPKNPLINEAFIRFSDDEFELTRQEINNLKLSEHLTNSLQKYCEESVWSTAQTA